MHHPLLHLEIKTINNSHSMVNHHRSTKKWTREANPYICFVSVVTLVDSTLTKEIGMKGEKESYCFQWTNNVTREEKESEKVTIFMFKRPLVVKFTKFRM